MRGLLCSCLLIVHLPSGSRTFGNLEGLGTRLILWYKGHKKVIPVMLDWSCAWKQDVSRPCHWRCVCVSRGGRGGREVCVKVWYASHPPTFTLSIPPLATPHILTPFLSPLPHTATCNGQPLVSVVTKVLSGNHGNDTKLAAAQWWVGP